MTREERSASYGPVDEQGAALAPDELRLTVAARAGGLRAAASESG
jgi:hypothetical protein